MKREKEQLGNVSIVITISAALSIFPVCSATHLSSRDIRHLCLAPMLPLGASIHDKDRLLARHGGQLAAFASLPGDGWEHTLSFFFDGDAVSASDRPRLSVVAREGASAAAVAAAAVVVALRSSSECHRQLLCPVRRRPMRCLPSCLQSSRPCATHRPTDAHTHTYTHASVSFFFLLVLVPRARRKCSFRLRNRAKDGAATRCVVRACLAGPQKAGPSSSVVTVVAE